MINEYIERLKEELRNRNYNDVDGMISYFEEIIKDRIDNGEKEIDIINDLEDPKVIASSLTNEVSLSDFKDVLKDLDDVTEEMKEDTENVYYFDYVNSIDVDVTSAYIEMYTSDSDKVIVKVIGNNSSKIIVENDDEELSISQENIIFNIGWPFFKGKGREDYIRIIIELPFNEYNELDLNNVSGKTNLMDLNFKEVDIQTVSGDINITSCNFKYLALQGVSGDINATSLIGEEIQVECVSGNINLNYLYGEEIEIENVSGDIEILIEGNKDDYVINTSKILNDTHYDNGGDKTIDIETVSGDIDYKFTN